MEFQEEYTDNIGHLHVVLRMEKGDPVIRTGAVVSYKGQKYFVGGIDVCYTMMSPMRLMDVFGLLLHSPARADAFAAEIFLPECLPERHTREEALKVINGSTFDPDAIEAKVAERPRTAEEALLLELQRKHV